MASDARRTARTGVVLVVSRVVVLARGMRVTRSANLIALVFETRGVRVVAIRTANPLVVHFRLQERPVYIHFIQNLAVRVVRLFVQQLGGEVVEEVVFRTIIRVQGPAS